MARPVRASTASRRFPSRNAAAMPRTKTLVVNVTSCPSTNEIAAPSSQNAAGAAKGKRRRAKQRQHQRPRSRAQRTTVSCAARRAIAPEGYFECGLDRRSTISVSNPYLRASGKRPFTCRTYSRRRSPPPTKVGRRVGGFSLAIVPGIEKWRCRLMQATVYADGSTAMASIEISRPRGSATLAGAERAGGGSGMKRA